MLFRFLNTPFCPSCYRDESPCTLFYIFYDGINSQYQIIWVSANGVSIRHKRTIHSNRGGTAPFTLPWAGPLFENTFKHYTVGWMRPALKNKQAHRLQYLNASNNLWELSFLSSLCYVWRLSNKKYTTQRQLELKIIQGWDLKIHHWIFFCTNLLEMSFYVRLDKLL